MNGGGGVPGVGKTEPKITSQTALRHPGEPGYLKTVWRSLSLIAHHSALITIRPLNVLAVRFLKF